MTFAGYNLLFGLVPGISNAAHLGGLLTGLGLGAVLSKSITEPPPLRVRWRNYATVGVTLLLLAGEQLPTTEDRGSNQPRCCKIPYRLFKHGNFGQAIPGLKQAVERDPNSPQARYLLGMAYVGAHQSDTAIPSFQEALRLKPDYADAEEGLGMAYEAKGMFERIPGGIPESRRVRSQRKIGTQFLQSLRSLFLFLVLFNHLNLPHVRVPTTWTSGLRPPRK